MHETNLISLKSSHQLMSFLIKFVKKSAASISQGFSGTVVKHEGSDFLLVQRCSRKPNTSLETWIATHR